MKQYFSILSLLFLFFCSREVPGKNGFEFYPSEVYINTHEEIFSHYSLEQKGNTFIYDKLSKSFEKLEVETKDGRITRMRYSLKPGGLENLVLRLSLKYDLDLKNQSYHGQLLFSEYGKDIKFDLTSETFLVYVE